MGSHDLPANSDSQPSALTLDREKGTKQFSLANGTHHRVNLVLFLEKTGMSLVRRLSLSVSRGVRPQGESEAQA